MFFVKIIFIFIFITRGVQLDNRVNPQGDNLMFICTWATAMDLLCTVKGAFLISFLVPEFHPNAH